MADIEQADLDADAAYRASVAHRDVLRRANAVDPMAVIASAIERGLSADTMEKLVAMQERISRAQAAERFGESLAAFQAACPFVAKTRKADRYKFAGFEDVIEVARPHLHAAGIGVSFSTPKEDDGIFVMNCRIQVGSHFEDRPFRAPMPDLKAIAKEVKLSEPQAFGYVLSYYKRYAICAALNIVVSDEDSDMAAAPMKISEEDQAKVLKLIEDTSADLPRFLAWCQQATGQEVDAVCDIPQSHLKEALRRLREKVAKGGAK